MVSKRSFAQWVFLIGLQLLNSSAWGGTGPFVYAASWGNADPASISAYRVGTSGALVPVQGSPFATGDTPTSLTVDPTGRFVYVTHHDGMPGSVRAYAINRSTGALSAVAGSPFSVGWYPTSVAVDARGRFAYVTNSLNNTVSGFRINGLTGALSAMTGSPFPVGGDPQSVTVDPTGRFAYVANHRSNDVSAFTIDQSTGALRPVNGSPFRSGSSPQSVTVDPSGRFAYVGNNGFISAFAIDWQTGGLTQIRGSPFPAEGAYAMALDPSGRFAYVATDSPFIGAFTIDQVTGALRPMSGSPFLAPGGTPISVAVDANGQFAYFADFNLPYAVTAYAINHTTGMLTAVPGSPFAAGSFPFSVATTPGPASLRFSGVLGTGGSFSSDDNYRHAFVGQPNGSVWEIYWDRPMNQGQDLIANFDPHAGSIAGLASTFGFGNVRHALVATDDGNLTDIVFSPNQPGPPRRTLWANFDPRASSLVAVGAYARQGFEVHAIVATSDGDVADVYQPAIFPGPVQVRPLTNFDPRASGPIVGIAGLFSSDQNFEHAIVGTLNGDVTEVFYRTGQPGIGRALLAHFPPSSTIVGVGGFFSGDDNYRHAIVATSNGNVTEIFYNPYLGQGQVVLANFDPAVSTIAGVAGFFSPDDNFRHVLVATSDGNIHEILYSPVTAPMIVREL